MSSVCDVASLDVIAEALQLLDSRDLVQFALAEPTIMQYLRTSGWVFHATHCLTPAALTELANLGVKARLDSYHRRTLPSSINNAYIEEWLAPDGRRHREDDLPALTGLVAGMAMWYHHGKPHRENDRPAIVRCTGQWWCFRGQLHRENDLPAIVWANGMREWWVRQGQALPQRRRTRDRVRQRGLRVALRR